MRKLVESKLVSLDGIIGSPDRWQSRAVADPCFGTSYSRHRQGTRTASHDLLSWQTRGGTRPSPLGR